MCNKTVDNYTHSLEFVPDCYMTQTICTKVVDTHSLQQNLFLNTIRLKKCVIKHLINVFFYFFIFLIDIKFRIISDDPFSLRYALNKCKPQQICDNAVDDCLAVLKFNPDFFVISKMIKIFLLLCTQMKRYSILLLILAMSYLFVMEWVFLI